MKSLERGQDCEFDPSGEFPTKSLLPRRVLEPIIKSWVKFLEPPLIIPIL